MVPVWRRGSSVVPSMSTSQRPPGTHLFSLSGTSQVIAPNSQGAVGHLSEGGRKYLLENLGFCDMIWGRVKEMGFWSGWDAVRKRGFYDWVFEYVLPPRRLDWGWRCNWQRSSCHSFAGREAVSYFAVWTVFVFCLCSGMITGWVPKGVLSDILWHCLWSVGEEPGPALKAWPAPRCQGLIFSFFFPQ